MAEQDTSPDADLQLKKRARRRLLGAVALALFAVIVLPMVMDREPRPSAPDIQVRIPSQDATGLAAKILPGKPATTPMPAPEPKPVTEQKPDAKAVAETPAVSAPPIPVAAKAAESAAAPPCRKVRRQTCGSGEEEHGSREACGKGECRYQACRYRFRSVGGSARRVQGGGQRQGAAVQAEGNRRARLYRKAGFGPGAAYPSQGRTLCQSGSRGKGACENQDHWCGWPGSAKVGR